MRKEEWGWSGAPGGEARPTTRSPSLLLLSSDGGRVVLDDGCTIDYDWLVLALGSDTATFGVPGVVEHCAAFNTYTDAVALHNKLKEVQSASGAPATAISAVVDEDHKRSNRPGGASLGAVERGRLRLLRVEMAE